MSEISCNC